jgi:hypothetical protein
VGGLLPLGDHEGKPAIQGIVRTVRLSLHLLIAGGRHFTDCPALRAALNALLANRLPDVELLNASHRKPSGLLTGYALVLPACNLCDAGRTPNCSALQTTRGVTPQLTLTPADSPGAGRE